MIPQGTRQVVPYSPESATIDIPRCGGSRPDRAGPRALPLIPEPRRKPPRLQARRHRHLRRDFGPADLPRRQQEGPGSQDLLMEAATAPDDTPAAPPLLTVHFGDPAWQAHLGGDFHAPEESGGMSWIWMGGGKVLGDPARRPAGLRPADASRGRPALACSARSRHLDISVVDDSGNVINGAACRPKDDAIWQALPLTIPFRGSEPATGQPCDMTLRVQKRAPLTLEIRSDSAGLARWTRQDWPRLSLTRANSSRPGSSSAARRAATRPEHSTSRHRAPSRRLNWRAGTRRAETELPPFPHAGADRSAGRSDSMTTAPGFGMGLPFRPCPLVVLGRFSAGFGRTSPSSEPPIPAGA